MAEEQGGANRWAQHSVAQRAGAAFPGTLLCCAPERLPAPLQKSLSFATRRARLQQPPTSQ